MDEYPDTVQLTVMECECPFCKNMVRLPIPPGDEIVLPRKVVKKWRDDFAYMIRRLKEQRELIMEMLAHKSALTLEQVLPKEAAND